MAETWLESGYLLIEIDGNDLHLTNSADACDVLLYASTAGMPARLFLKTNSYQWYINNNDGGSLIFIDDSDTEMYLTAGGNLVIDGKLTETGCPANIKNIWKDLIKAETIKPEPPRDAKGRIDKPRKINDEGEEVIDEEKMEDFVNAYYHNTGEMVMALAYGLLEAHDKIDDLQSQIDELKR